MLKEFIGPFLRNSRKIRECHTIKHLLREIRRKLYFSNDLSSGSYRENSAINFSVQEESVKFYNTGLVVRFGDSPRFTGA